MKDSVTPDAYTAKVRVTASLDHNLVRAIDELAKAGGHLSRSGVIEEALRYWIAEQRRRELEKRIEEYYLSLSKAERKEDREWAKGASRAAAGLWE